jgi:succinate dehydrogenase / fumarate reductase iron-sulfur subunit/fumarate reductase iron-sulfur subunit
VGHAGHNAGPTETVTVLVRRSATSNEDRFVIRRQPRMKVLDLLVAIQRDHDPSLAFRYSCRVAMCGTCALRMDGTAGLACQTAVPDHLREVHLAPLAGLPVLRDLVVDVAPFFARWAAVTPYLVPHPGATAPARVRPDSPERQVIDPALDCITCGICYSACSVSEDGRDFLGPAALNRAMVLIADSRDASRSERLARIGNLDGVDRCHYIGGCTSCCPKDLDPFGAIRQLRRWRLTGIQGIPTP